MITESFKQKKKSFFDEIVQARLLRTKGELAHYLLLFSRRSTEIS